MTQETQNNQPPVVQVDKLIEYGVALENIHNKEIKDILSKLFLTSLKQTMQQIFPETEKETQEQA